VAEVKTYHANLVRDGQFWNVRVPEVERSTQARTLSEAEAMARDLVAIMEDIPPDSFEVEVKIVLPDDVRREMQRSADLRQQAASKQAEAAQIAREVALRLRDELGMSLRDIGKALGVTFQRAKQLLDEARNRQTRV
jgi:DNA-directed RNA polymerase specialized sigma24 family protein